MLNSIALDEWKKVQQTLNTGKNTFGGQSVDSSSSSEVFYIKFAKSELVWTLNKCLVSKILNFRHILSKNVSENQTFCSDFRHFRVMSEIWTFLFGFRTSSDFRQSF